MGFHFMWRFGFAVEWFRCLLSITMLLKEEKMNHEMALIDEISRFVYKEFCKQIYWRNNNVHPEE